MGFRNLWHIILRVLQLRCITVNAVTSEGTIKHNYLGAKNSYLDQTLYLICNQSSLQYSEIISIAFDIYNSPYLLYKSISAMLLANAYYKLNDLNNANLFNLKANEFAPSNETLFCIEKILNRQF